jgi:hypothetical protein
VAAVMEGTGATVEQRVELKHPSHHILEPNPALVRQAETRAKSIENRIADRITEFAGSMPFVYIHIAWFGCWIALGVEKYPYGLLTMIVSLEAIFLSTFVMISQNRADAKRQAIADQQWQTVRGQAERRAARALASDPRPHEGDSRGLDPAIGGVERDDPPRPGVRVSRPRFAGGAGRRDIA